MMIMIYLIIDGQGKMILMRSVEKTKLSLFIIGEVEI